MGLPKDKPDSIGQKIKVGTTILKTSKAQLDKFQQSPLK